MTNKVREQVKSTLAKRYAAERRFRLFGLVSVMIGLAFLCLMMFTIISKGLPAFTQSYIQLSVNFDLEELEISDVNNEEAVQYADYDSVLKQALYDAFPDVSGRKAKKQFRRFLSSGAGYRVSKQVANNLDWFNTTQDIWVLAGDEVNLFMKGYIRADMPENERQLNDQQMAWLATLKEEGKLKKRFNTAFFQYGDSREPELAGILGALKGSLLTVFVTLLLSFPIGVAAAVYLEEFAPSNWFSDVIEVNINNLAAVPSIVYGLLGLAIFINFFELPRSAPLVGGLVLTLMTLPTIIISSRSALKAVPPSIREAALGLGASKMQVVFHHVVPLAMPGMLTGTIIGMAQALGETAPLLMIGMVAFVVEVPQGITDPATVLPVQIFLWADSPERGFEEKTAAAIMVLLVFLITMNSLAVYLRKQFERRW